MEQQRHEESQPSRRTILKSFAAAPVAAQTILTGYPLVKYPIPGEKYYTLEEVEELAFIRPQIEKIISAGSSYSERDRSIGILQMIWKEWEEYGDIIDSRSIILRLLHEYGIIHALPRTTNIEWQTIAKHIVEKIELQREEIRSIIALIMSEVIEHVAQKETQQSQE